MWCRIPHVNLLGYDAASGDMLLYNFWKDSKVILQLLLATPRQFCHTSSLLTTYMPPLIIVPRLFRIRKDFGAKQH